MAFLESHKTFLFHKIVQQVYIYVRKHLAPSKLMPGLILKKFSAKTFDLSAHPNMAKTSFS